MAIEKADFGARLVALRRMLGLKQVELGRRLGRDAKTVSRYETGAHEMIAFAMLADLETLCREAGQDLYWLLTGDRARTADEAQAQELRITQAVMSRLGAALGFDPADPEQRITLHQVAALSTPAAVARHQVSRLVEPGFRTIEPEQLPEDAWQAGYVPVISRIAAGEGLDTEEAEAHPPGWADEFLLYKDAPPGAFAVRVVGDSMRPDYAEGDMIVVDPRRHADRGVCVVIYEDGGDGARRARLKRLRRRGRQAVLESINPDYSPVAIPLDRVCAAYEVYDHLPRIRQAPAAPPPEDTP